MTIDKIMTQKVLLDHTWMNLRWKSGMTSFMIYLAFTTIGISKRDLAITTGKW